MTSPLELNLHEVRGLISLLNSLPCIPPDLVNVPSKLEVARKLSNMGVFYNYPTPEHDGLWNNIQSPRLQSNLDTPLLSRDICGLSYPGSDPGPCLFATPRRIFSSGSSPHPSPHHAAGPNHPGLFATPRRIFSSGSSSHHHSAPYFLNSSPSSIAPGPNHPGLFTTPRHLFSPGSSSYPLSSVDPFSTAPGFEGPLSIGDPTLAAYSNLGRRERSSSPHSTPRVRRHLEFGGESRLGSPDEEGGICGANGTTEDGACGDTGASMHAENASTQGQGRGRGRGRGRGHGHGRGRGRGRGGGRGQDRCNVTRGAAAPPAWIYDPRIVDDSDLQEEVFEPSATIQDRHNDQLQQPGPIPGPSARPEPKNQALSSPGYHFVLDLATACRTYIFEPENSVNPITRIFNILRNSTSTSEDVRAQSRLLSIMSVDTLENIADRCIMAEENVAVTDFVFMVNAIQLRCKVISTCKATGHKKTPILQGIKSHRCTRTLARYVSDGAKFCLLAGGASFFILAIASAAKLRSNIRSLTHDIILRINYLLRCPNPDHTLGRLVIQDIIPAISLLRQQFRATFSSIFNHELLFSNGVLPEIEAGNFLRSDEFFNSITYNAFIKYRCVRTWESCYSPLPGSVPLSPFYLINHAILSSRPVSTQLYPGINHSSVDDISSPLSSPDDDPDLNFNSQSDGTNTSTPIFTIDTNYDPSLPRNIKVEYKVENRVKFTDKERGFAMQAKTCESLADLTTKLRDQLSRGKKTKKRYLQITHQTLQGKRLRIRDSNNDILLLACPDLPKHLRDRLLTSLKAACPNNLQWTDSTAAKEFLALHFCWWNRYSTSGEGAPSDVEPAALRKEGLKRSNTSTFTPRTSKELQQHMEEYIRLEECFQDVFHWIKKTLQEILPEDYSILGQYADVLPGDGFSPAYPFSGFVINFNVSTRIHRDVNDKKLCIVMAISDDNCQGGDICFLEPGIRLELLCGDMVLFPSSKISHFNLDFKGERASLVLHSDGTGDNWVKNRNQWAKNIYMNVEAHN